MMLSKEKGCVSINLQNVIECEACMVCDQAALQSSILQVTGLRGIVPKEAKTNESFEQFSCCKLFSLSHQLDKSLRAE